VLSFSDDENSDGDDVDDDDEAGDDVESKYVTFDNKFVEFLLC